MLWDIRYYERTAARHSFEDRVWPAFIQTNRNEYVRTLHPRPERV